MDPTITCPNCGHPVPLTESLAAPLVAATRQHYEARLEAQARAAAQQREADKSALAKQAEAHARELLAQDLATRDKRIADQQRIIEERNKKLEEAQAAQAAILREREALADKERELELTIQKRLHAEREQLREKAAAEAREALALQLTEKDEQLAAAKRQAEDLKRRLEQGSQQLQGEALELALESRLRTRFPQDAIEPVPKGAFGGDIIHRVIGPAGQPCGTVLWESKRTKNWSDGWLAKLRADQRAAHAEIAVLVSQTVPRGLELFDHVEGIWVVEPRCALPVAIALRQALIELAGARLASAGQQTKAEQVYAYLTGQRFRHRIGAIIEKFQSMQEDLDRERLMAQKMWAKRESQIRGVLEATAGLYGDLQGIAGSSIPEIEALDMPLLEAD